MVYFQQHQQHPLNRGLRGGSSRVLQSFGHNDDPILTKFKHDHDLKEDAVLDLQMISDTNTVNVAGKEYSLDSLESLNIFTDNATYTFDGELQLLPPVSKGLFVGTDGTGDSIFVTTNEKNEVDSVDVFHAVCKRDIGRGFVVPALQGVFVQV